MYEDYQDEETRRAWRNRPQDEEIVAPVHPGANTGHGPWAPGYDPGPNFNDGQAPAPGAVWDMTDNAWDVPTKQPTAVDRRAPAPPPPPAPTPQAQFQPPAPAPMAATAPQAAPASAATPAAPAPSYQTPPVTDEVTKILMARLNELRNPRDFESDPEYQNAVRAYQVQSLRGADRQRKALAERSAAGGTRATGGFNVGVRGILERQGENAAQYTSGLALDRLNQREQQLAQAISMARAVGQDAIANQLEVQRLQLQQELGRGDLSLRSELGRGQLELGRGNLGLGYDQLGFNYADMVRRANSEATIAGLRG